MTGNDVDVRVADGDERLVEVVRRPNLAGGAEEAPVRCALETALDRVRAHVHQTSLLMRLLIRDLRYAKGPFRCEGAFQSNAPPDAGGACVSAVLLSSQPLWSRANKRESENKA